ncbi:MULTISPECIES: hypothetical protein [unclassified Paenibacillus]|uniref:hypothetical protein n=1 Tax=unclassified Paenibacillus TaxID=185978 RepID=UPI000970A357|nr:MULTISPECIES: hypothetical protein [unclassified Paenibacillus]ASS68935.2 DUF2642 domain-containing protein [Paenibacillus sp. RUD330]
MKSEHPWQNRFVTVILEGGGRLEGLLCEMGEDMLSMFILPSRRYGYIPLVQVKELSLSPVPAPEGSPIAEDHPYRTPSERMTYRKILLASKGSFSEIKLSSNRQLHGYLAGVMNDFLIFCAPMNGAVLVPLGSLRCLSPYPSGLAPYHLTPEQFPLRPLSLGLARSFSQQLAKLQGEFIVAGRGELPDLSGVLASIDGQLVTLTDASGSSVCLHFSAIEALHL